jgi:hypothetical protein
VTQDALPILQPGPAEPPPETKITRPVRSVGKPGGCKLELI